MVPVSWKGKEVSLRDTAQSGPSEMRLEEITESGVVMTWQGEDSAERRVFYPWHVIDTLELTDLRGPAEPNIRRLGI
jgi:hypothetical protein